MFFCSQKSVMNHLSVTSLYIYMKKNSFDLPSMFVNIISENTLFSVMLKEAFQSWEQLFSESVGDP